MRRSDTPGGHRGDRAGDPLRRDLEAFRQASLRDLPTIDETAAEVRKRMHGEPGKDHRMHWMEGFKTRPRLSAALAAVVLIAVVGALPVSYDRTVGYEARLDVGGPLPAGISPSALADRFETALGAETCTVRPDGDGISILATLGLGDRRFVEGTAAAFAAGLTARGLSASAAVRPKIERVNGNVYAMAANEVLEIRIESEGKTAEDMEDDIRAQLEAAGFADPLVDVEIGEGEMKIRMEIASDGDGATGPVEVHVDGLAPPPVGGDRAERVIELRLDGTGKTPEQLREEVRARMQAAGMGDAEVEIFEEPDGSVRVVARSTAGDAEPPGDPEMEITIDIEQTVGDGDVNASPPAPEATSESWGDVKKHYR